MSDVFILGAGFSKAISRQMPLLKELSAEVLKSYKHAAEISIEVQRMIEDDFETALTYLSQDKPWLSESENLRHKALYLDLTCVIRGVLNNKSVSALTWGQNQAELWIEALITYWHRNQSIVLTLNYDTLIERVASAVNWQGRSKSIPTGSLYSIPLTIAGSRTGGVLPVSPIKTFKLFKLHGSINWFYSGRSTFYGEELFYVPCVGGVDGCFDKAEGRDPELKHWANTNDKTALIIPPTLDKGAYFQHESLRSMWFQAGQAIKNASRIISMGYSLPASDLTMAQFLKSSAPDKPISFQIVDRISKVEHFTKVVGTGIFDFEQKEASEDCIKQFVIQQCIPDAEEKRYVIGMSV